MRFLAFRIATSAFCSLVFAQTAAARDWPKTAGWTIIEGDDECSIFSDFEGKGSTELLVMLNTDGTAAASLTNLRWSSAKGEKYDLRWKMNDYEYSGTAIGLGDRFDARRGFAAKFPGKFIDDFAAGVSLTVYRGEVVVDDLNLAGTSAAVATAKRCLAAVRFDIAAREREKRRLAHISDDPFASPPTESELVAAAEGIPIPLNVPAIAPLSEYPWRAVRDSHQGTSRYRLVVSSEGAATDCLVIQSSGHRDLDEETCAFMLRGARFRPQSESGIYIGNLQWKLSR